MTLPIDGEEMWKVDNSVTKICIPEHFCAFKFNSSYHPTYSLHIVFRITC